MTELKCPICGKQMKIGTLDQDDSLGTVWMSIMPCDCVCSYGASKAVWQALIDTKKKLDMAINAMESAKGHNIINCAARGVDPKEDDVHLTLFKALKKIKDKEENE